MTRGAERRRMLAKATMAPTAARTDEQPKRRQFDMNVGVSCADDDAVVVVEQEVAVQSVGPRLDHEEKAEQRGGMGDRRGRSAPGRRIEADVAVEEVDRAGHQTGEREQPEEPVLERDIDRQREEVEADVLAELRIVAAVWRLVKEPKDEVPAAGLARGDQQSEDDATARIMRRHAKGEG